MQQTIDQIVGASHLPLSVVIVGIGGEDFSKMVSKNESSTAGTAVYNNACKGRQRHKKKKGVTPKLWNNTSSISPFALALALVQHKHTSRDDSTPTTNR